MRALGTISLCVGFAAALALSPGPAAADEQSAFEAASRILVTKCQRCHGGAAPVMGMSLEHDQVYRSTVNIPSRTTPGVIRVVPGSPETSLLYLKLLPPSEGQYRGPRMPMNGELDASEIAVIRAWIESFPLETWGLPLAASAPAQRQGYSPLFHDRFLAHFPGPDTLGRGTLEFRFSHLFKSSVADAGADNLYGLDTGAWTSLGLAYGIANRLDVGLRRSNLLQDYEAYVKGALIRQETGGAPLSLSAFGSFIRLDQTGVENRNGWAVQMILARRFTEWLSLAFVPTYVAHTNYLDGEDHRGTPAAGGAAEVRLNSYLALTGEWITQLGGVENLYSGGTIGVSFRTSKHSFHILFTNLPGIQTNIYAPGGDLRGDAGQFRLGFNISRLWYTKKN